MRILVVDDDKESRDLLCEVLSASEYAVDAVENVAAARRRLGSSNDYRIVIADLRMPDGTGLELLRDVGKQNSKPSVILISSYLSGLERKRARELGVGALLEKPFRFGDLLQAVADLAAPKSVEMVS
jgi:DNA-binding response OmpR family regulator